MSNRLSEMTGKDWNESLEKSAEETPFYFCTRHPEVEATHSVKFLEIVTIGCCNDCAKEIADNCGSFVTVKKNEN